MSRPSRALQDLGVPAGGALGASVRANAEGGTRDEAPLRTSPDARRASDQRVSTKTVTRAEIGCAETVSTWRKNGVLPETGTSMRPVGSRASAASERTSASGFGGDAVEVGLGGVEAGAV